MNTPADILNDAYIYILIIILGYPVSVANNYVGTLIRAVGDGKNEMVRGIISTFVNVVLDLVFVLVLHMGVAGAAIATVIANIVNFVIALIYYFKKYPELHVKKQDFKWDWQIIKRTIGIGLPMGLQSSITMIGCTLIQSAVNSLGTNYVAAFTTGTKVESLLTTPVQTLTSATTPFIAQNFGAAKPKRIYTCMRQVGGICAIYGIVVGMLFAFTGKYMALMYINSYETETLSLLAFYSKFSGMCLILLCMLYFIRNTVQALGYSAFAAVGGGIELLTRALIAFFLLGPLGYTAICLSNPLSWLFTGTFLFIAFFKVIYKRLRRMEKQERRADERIPEKMPVEV